MGRASPPQTPPKSASRKHEHNSYPILLLARNALGRGLGRSCPPREKHHDLTKAPTSVSNAFRTLAPMGFGKGIPSPKDGNE